MFERFTEASRQVVVASADIARGRGLLEITPWDLLIALRESEGLAGTYLEADWYPDETDLRERVAQEGRANVGRQGAPVVGQIPFTKAVKDALDLSLREALSMGHNYIGTEHLLLGLCRGAKTELPLIPPYARVHDDLIRLLSGRAPDAPLAWPSDLSQVAEEYLNACERVVLLLDRDDGVSPLELGSALSTAEKTAGAFGDRLRGLTEKLKKK